MKEFAQNLMVLMAKGDEPWSSHRFQSGCEISHNFVVGAKMISTSAFLDSAFQACVLTCDCLIVLGKHVLSVLNQSISLQKNSTSSYVLDNREVLEHDMRREVLEHKL